MPSSRVSTQGRAGLCAKMFNKEISFTPVVHHLLFHSADELRQVALSGRQEEVGKNTFGENIYSLQPSAGWHLAVCDVAGQRKGCDKFLSLYQQ